MKKKIIIAIVVIALIAVVYFVSNKSDQNQNTSIDQKVKVGVILPLSGQYASFGEGVKNAMLMSYEDLKTKNVELIFEDGEFDSAKSLSAYNKLQNFDKVDMVVGLVNPTLEAVKPIINKTNELMFTVGNEASIEKDNVFEIIPWAAGLFKTLGENVSGKYKKIGLVYASDSQLFMTNKKLMVQGLGSQEYVEIPVSSNSDVRTEVSKMLNEGVDSYTVFLSVEQGTKFINEVTKQTRGKKAQLICDANIELTIGDYLKKVNDKSAFDGCLSTMIADTTDKSYVDEYKAKYNSDPNFLSVYGYDSVQLISDVLAKVPKSEWKKTLEKDGFSWKGVSGTISFDDTGSRALVSEPHIFKDGKFVKAN